eukprot:5396556-Amphidinium_carterae.1
MDGFLARSSSVHESVLVRTDKCRRATAEHLQYSKDAWKCINFVNECSDKRNHPARREMKIEICASV